MVVPAKIVCEVRTAHKREEKKTIITPQPTSSVEIADEKQNSYRKESVLEESPHDANPTASSTYTK